MSMVMFEGKRSKSIEKLEVEVRKVTSPNKDTGYIVFNKAIQRKLIKRCKFVDLYFDEDTRSMGFVFSKTKTHKHSYSVWGQKGFAATMPVAFFKRNKIDYKTNRTLSAKAVKFEGKTMLVAKEE